MKGNLIGVSYGIADAPGIRVSDDGALSFYSTVGNYRYYQIAHTSSAAYQSIGELLVCGFGTANSVGFFEIQNLNSAGANVICSARANAGSGTQLDYTCICTATTSAVDHIRIFSRTGNAATGGKLVLSGVTF